MNRDLAADRRRYAQQLAAVSFDAPPAPLRDYTWPQRMPLDQLRRVVALELQAAADLARIHFPDWK